MGNCQYPFSTDLKSDPDIICICRLSENMSWINEMGRESGNMNRFLVSPSSSSSSCTSAVVDPKLSSSLGVSRTLSSSSVDLDASVQNLIDKMQNGLKVEVNWTTPYYFISGVYFSHHWGLNSVVTDRRIWLSKTRTVALAVTVSCLF